MMAQRENGVDVDVWTMDEIVPVVEEFIRQQDSEMAGDLSVDLAQDTTPEDSYREDSLPESSLVEDPTPEDITKDSKSVLKPPENIMMPSKSEDVPRYATFTNDKLSGQQDSLNPEGLTRQK